MTKEQVNLQVNLQTILTVKATHFTCKNADNIRCTFANLLTKERILQKRCYASMLAYCLELYTEISATIAYFEGVT